jgi:hypothetical protein
MDEDPAFKSDWNVAQPDEETLPLFSEGASVPKSPTLYAVPANAMKGKCRGCGAVIYWIERAGKFIPIDTDVDGGTEPTRKRSGLGVSHFLTCPDAAKFSGKNRKPRR